MNAAKSARTFLLSRESEKGQYLLLFALILLFVLLPIAGAYWLDQERVHQEIDNRQKATDEACWNASVTYWMGGDPIAAAAQTLNGYGYSSEYYTPAAGTGSNLAKGIERETLSIGSIPVPGFRVAIWGPSQTVFHQFVGNPNDWGTGGRTLCTAGLGGAVPILIKEWEPPVWEWGNTVVMFGDGWDPNIGVSQDPTGIGNPDIYCINGGPTGDCSIRQYFPPASEGAQVNTLKDIVMGYLKYGYPGILPPVSTFIPRQSGLANHQTVQAFISTHQDGQYVTVIVIRDGAVYTGEKGFDNVEVIGYAIFQVDSHDANTVWGHPVTPILTSLDQLRQYPLDPTLLEWR